MCSNLTVRNEDKDVTLRARSHLSNVEIDGSSSTVKAVLISLPKRQSPPQPVD